MNLRKTYLGACGVIGVLGLAMLTSTYWFTYTVNLTGSLPGHIYAIKLNEAAKKGDLVAFRWHGGATYPKGTIFIKRVVGGPGDTVKRIGNEFWVNEQYIGAAKPKSKAGVPLTPANPGVIPEGQLFVATPSPDSLDSRYAESGNVNNDELIGKAYVLF